MVKVYRFSDPHLVQIHPGKLSIVLETGDVEIYGAQSLIGKSLFQKSLADKIKVDFMGDVDYFLGTAFTWTRQDDGHLAVHLCQSAFTEFTSNRFGVDKMNRVPNMSPYRSGMPIDSIPNADPHDPDLKRRTKLYQQIIGSINWLAQCSRPDVAPALTFLSSYNLAPHHQHYKAAIQADEKMAVALYNLGALAEQRGQLDEAESFYRKALSKDQTLELAVNNLGALLERKGGRDAARKLFYITEYVRSNKHRTAMICCCANTLL